MDPDRPTHDDAQDNALSDLKRRVDSLQQTRPPVVVKDNEAEIERRTQERVAAALEGVPELMTRAVEQGLRRVIEDPAVQTRFWESGYKELEKHAGSNAAQWLGRRMMNIVITAAIAGFLAWIVMTGRLK
jgi:alpha-L-fucosidase